MQSVPEENVRDIAIFSGIRGIGRMSEVSRPYNNILSEEELRTNPAYLAMKDYPDSWGLWKSQMSPNDFLDWKFDLNEGAYAWMIHRHPNDRDHLYEMTQEYESVHLPQRGDIIFINEPEYGRFTKGYIFDGKGLEWFWETGDDIVQIPGAFKVLSEFPLHFWDSPTPVNESSFDPHILEIFGPEKHCMLMKTPKKFFRKIPIFYIFDCVKYVVEDKRSDRHPLGAACVVSSSYKDEVPVINIVDDPYLFI